MNPQVQLILPRFVDKSLSVFINFMCNTNKNKQTKTNKTKTNKHMNNNTHHFGFLTVHPQITNYVKHPKFQDFFSGTGPIQSKFVPVLR